MTKKTFESIVTPCENIDRESTFLSEIKDNMKSLILRYIPSITTIPLFQGMSWSPTWKALPTHRWVGERTLGSVLRATHNKGGNPSKTGG